MPDVQQYCTFFVNGQYFGLEVLKVQEILRPQKMTRVPLAPWVVSGLINMRGLIVPAIDLRHRLGLPDRPTDAQPLNVVVHTDDGSVSLLVDEIGDVLEVAESTFERPPETLSKAARELIRGAYKLKDRLLLILDINKIVTPGAARHPSQGASL